MNPTGTKSFRKAVKKYLKWRYGYTDIDKVLWVWESHTSEGECETCRYRYTELRVVYRDKDGDEQGIVVRGSFSSLLDELTLDRK